MRPHLFLFTLLVSVPIFLSAQPPQNKVKITLRGMDGTFDLVEQQWGYKFEIFEATNPTPLKTIFPNDFVSFSALDFNPCDSTKLIKLKLDIASAPYYSPEEILLDCNNPFENPEFEFGYNLAIASVSTFFDSKTLNCFEPIPEDIIAVKKAGDLHRAQLDAYIKFFGLSDVQINMYEALSLSSFAEVNEIILNDSGEHLIKISLLYNKSVLDSLLEEPKQVKLKLILLHEIGHIIVRHHSGAQQELDADKFAGRWLRRNETALTEAEFTNAVEGLFNTYIPSADYPTKEERTKAMKAGWVSENNLINEANNANKTKYKQRVDSAELLLKNNSQEALSILTSLNDNGIGTQLVDRKNFLLASYYYDHDDHTLGEQFINSYLSNNPNNFDANYLKISNAIKQNDFSNDVVNAINTIIQLPNTDPIAKAEMYYLLSKIYVVREEYDNAITSAQNSIQLDKTNTLPRMKLLKAKKEKGDTDYLKQLALTNEIIATESRQITHESRITEAMKIKGELVQKAEILYINDNSKLKILYENFLPAGYNLKENTKTRLAEIYANESNYLKSNSILDSKTSLSKFDFEIYGNNLVLKGTSYSEILYWASKQPSPFFEDSKFVQALIDDYSQKRTGFQRKIKKGKEYHKMLHSNYDKLLSVHTSS